jgi:hypothetical protein
MIEGLVWPEEIKQQSKKAIFLLIFMEKVILQLPVDK